MCCRKWLQRIFVAFILFAAPFGFAQEQSDTREGQTAGAQNTSGSTEDLQKSTQNPVFSLISVPLQNNSNFGIGPFDRTQNILNIQPVIPTRISRNTNLIIRWIAPVVWQPAPGTTNLESLGIEENTPAFLFAQNAQANAGVFGFGDMNPTFSYLLQGRESSYGEPDQPLLFRPQPADIWGKENSAWGRLLSLSSSLDTGRLGFW